MDCTDIKVLAVIPARGGSKGIPRKNVRLMNGKPLISYAIENAKSCNRITDIVVSTDDQEVMGIAMLNQVDYIEREAQLSGDKVTLDPVVYDAMIQMERRKNIRYDIVVTLQPTSPLLRGETLNYALKSFMEGESDTYISATNKPHLAWSKNEAGYYPLYEERLNRQQLPPNYVETGAFFITKRKCVKPNSRMGDIVSIFEVPEEESIDIDNSSDWVICENALKRKRIVFRADGFKELGLGHIYHCLTLAYQLTGHDVIFVTKEQHKQGLDKIKSSFMPYATIQSEDGFYDFLKNWKADIVVNDCLDTSKEHIQKLKSLAKKVVTIEDLGEGAKFADAVINALYNKEEKLSNEYYGERYVCLRDEFMINKPKPFSREVGNVVVMFGGTDPSNLTEKIYRLALKINAKDPRITFNFITGGGYDVNLHGVVTISEQQIYVHNDVKRVTDYMKDADLAFTSQGRTVFELASMGIPSIVLAQNEREQLHTFAQMNNGFLNLGLGHKISMETLESTFRWLVDMEQIRNEMRQLMLKNDLTKGTERVIDIILKEY